MLGFMLGSMLGYCLGIRRFGVTLVDCQQSINTASSISPIGLGNGKWGEGVGPPQGAEFGSS